VRTLRFAFEEKNGRKLTVDDVLWTHCMIWAAELTNKYRRRADGRTAYEAAFGCSFNGEILPWGETALFKVPMSHTRAIALGVQMPKGDATMDGQGHLGREAPRVRRPLVPHQ
jgi:hypothetical protein